MCNDSCLQNFQAIVLIKMLLGAVEVRIHCMNVTETAKLDAQMLQVYTVVSVR